MSDDAKDEKKEPERWLSREESKELLAKVTALAENGTSKLREKREAERAREEKRREELRRQAAELQKNEEKPK